MTESADWRPLYPFTSHWTELAHGRMHYLDEGPISAASGRVRECLLFVHGNPTWSFHWRRMIEVLRPRFRCVAPDHIGCGLSDKPPRFFRLEDHIQNLVTLVERLKIDPNCLTLIAQDWGGAIGLGAMLALGAKPNGIALFNTGSFRPRYIPWRIRACRLPLVGRLAVQGGNLFSRAALRMTLARRPRLEPAVVAGYLAPYDNWPNRRAVYGFVRDIPSGPRHPTWQLLGDIERGLQTFADVPIVLAWGMQDWCFRPDSLERFMQVWPRADVHRLEDVGHWVLEDAPAESLALLKQFLDRSTEQAEATTAIPYSDMPA